MRVFADGESRLTLDAPRRRGTAVVVQSTQPPADTNLLQALLLVHKAGCIADKVVAVVPYMGYARQDREFLRGEIVTIEVVAGLFRAAGARRVYIVDMHSMAGLGLFGGLAVNVPAAPALAEHFGRMRLKDPLVVSPDAGGTARAAEFAGLLGTGHAALEKRRNRRTGSIAVSGPGLPDTENRDVVLVDDMISSGGSIIKAAGFLKGRGCGRIYVACTHALLVNDAERRIAEAGVEKIVGTNTVWGGTSRVDVSGLVAEAIEDAASGTRRRSRRAVQTGPQISP
ncbi:phosphoribosylpyrophosphate synthetase [Cenarchaeum symbiosum A]|uniref:ribose-phosphate diphosphokinase n=1 Tax=Cenarchaeum symbiosum (strain A) TaxID=414004 RepID=A0RYR1_CENSY|nr:phosphoribosylpyrophosphate synthetase [Cenarchaeum symbiosum A]